VIIKRLLGRLSGRHLAVIAIMIAAPFAHAQLFGGLVFDPTQSAHAIEQISQGEDMLTNTITLAQTAISAYNLAQLMASAPGSIYGAYISPSTYWMLLESTANTYGNSQAMMDTANSGTGADFSYQAASVQRYGPLPEYGTLTLEGQQQIAATGATTDVNDAVASSSLTTLGTMRANEIQREADIENLEAESQTMDPTQQTDLATEQRINQAALLQIRQQQESNQLQQAIALQQLVVAKQQQDVVKAHFQDAAEYGVNFQTNVAPAYGGGAQAMTY
jgi:hypothetical protein